MKPTKKTFKFEWVNDPDDSEQGSVYMAFLGAEGAEINQEWALSPVGELGTGEVLEFLASDGSGLIFEFDGNNGMQVTASGKFKVNTKKCTATIKNVQMVMEGVGYE